MSRDKWRPTKVDTKLLYDLVILSMFSSDISLDFHELILVVPLKYIYKRGLIETLLHKGFRLCSNYENFHQETETLKSIL